MRAETRAKLLRGIAQARIWLDQLISSEEYTTHSIAKTIALSERGLRSTLNLAFLAPDIVEAAIDGQLPRGITVTQLTDLPENWNEQRQVLGLA
jgi:site-specific DNA recombinase